MKAKKKANVKNLIEGYQGWYKVGKKPKKYFQPTPKKLYTETQIKKWTTNTEARIRQLRLKGKIKAKTSVGFRPAWKTKVTPAEKKKLIKIIHSKFKKKYNKVVKA